MRAVVPPLVVLALSLDPAFSWQPGDTNATTGFSVDTGRRNDVVSFWHSIYVDSEGYEDRIGWTGNYATCEDGSTTRVFQDDVQRRINFLRAMAGLPGDSLVNDGSTVFVDEYYNPSPEILRSEAVQQAAHMTSRKNEVDHEPPAWWPCFTKAAGNACIRGNLALGFYGPGAIDEYLRETSALGDELWSEPAGHRRWILYPGATVFASGDTPGGMVGNTRYEATNILYCVPTPGELASVPAGFTAWPSVGHFPDALNTVLWSLSHPGADFSQAMVSMTGPGGAVNVTLVNRTTTAYGDPAIVWLVPLDVGASSVTADTVYQVAVSGIQGGGVPTSHSYEVIVIDPNTVNEPMELTGSAAPPVGGARYAFESVDLADGHEVDVSVSVASGWTEGAEDSPAPRVIDETEPGYELRCAVQDNYYGNFWNNGSKGFRLGFESDYTDEDYFEIDRELVTGAAPTLSYWYRRGYMYPGTAMQMETSVNGGVSWQAAGPEITGKVTKYPDAAFVEVDDVPLPANHQNVRVRFRHYWKSGFYYTILAQPTYPIGVFIDDITVSGVEELESIATLSLGAEASSFWFDSSSVGQSLVVGESYGLRLRAVMDSHRFSFGPTREVTVSGAPLSGYEAWEEYEQPLLSGGFDDDDDGDGLGNGAEYAFWTDPLAASPVTGTLVSDVSAGMLRLTRELVSQRSDLEYGAEWSEDMASWSTSGVSVSFAAGELKAELAMGGERRFLRWRITRAAE